MAEKIRVMVIDDNPQIRDIISEYIKMQDYAEVVGEACDGIEAIKKLQEIQPDNN
jgi:chemotaxis response regulator CheB